MILRLSIFSSNLFLYFSLTGKVASVKKPWRGLITSIVMFLGLSVPVYAAGDKPVFGIIDWFPFGWQEAEKPVGMFVDMVNAINQTLEIDAQSIVSPVPRVIRAADVGEIDFTITYRDTEMLKTVEFLVDIGCLKAAIVSFKSSPVMSLQGLNGRRVAYPGGGYFVKRFLSTLDLDGVEVAQTDIMFRMAARKRLEAFVINDAVWHGYRQDMHPTYKVPSTLWPELTEPLYLETLPLSISVARGSGQDELAKELKGIMKNRAFKKALLEIYKKYKLPNAIACLKDEDGN